MHVAVKFEYEGKAWHRVGMRFKGSTSLIAARDRNKDKMSFRLRFDKFEDIWPEVDNQRFFGFEELHFNANYDDQSFLRERIAADVRASFSSSPFQNKKIVSCGGLI